LLVGLRRSDILSELALESGFADTIHPGDLFSGCASTESRFAASGNPQVPSGFDCFDPNI
jgi:hypothetical protein